MRLDQRVCVDDPSVGCRAPPQHRQAASSVDAMERLAGMRVASRGIALDQATVNGCAVVAMPARRPDVQRGRFPRRVMELRLRGPLASGSVLGSRDLGLPILSSEPYGLKQTNDEGVRWTW